MALPARDPAASPEAYVARWRSTGDPQAFGALFDTTASVLFRVAVTLVPDAATAEDVLQQTYTVALRKLARMEPGRPVMPWLLNVLQKEAAKARRRMRRMPDPARLEMRAPSPDPVGALEVPETEAVRAAIESLEEPYRSAALLRWRYGLEPSEIAHVRGEPPGTTRSVLSRALERLKRGAPALPAAFFGDIRAPRGLGQVRASVIGQAAAGASAVGLGTAAGLLAGGLLVKKAIAGVVVLAALVGGWAVLRAPRGSERIGEREGDRPGSPAMVELAAAPEAAAKARAAAPASESVTPLVEGRVVDEDGKPIRNAFIVLDGKDRSSFIEGDSAHPDPTHSAGSTQADGRFSIPMPDVARGRGLVLADGYTAGQIEDVAPGRVKDVVMRRAGTLHGRVLDSRGRSIVGARVRWIAILGAFHTEQETTSDASGAWSLGEVRSLGTKVYGGARLVVYADGYARQILDPYAETGRTLAELSGDVEIDVVLSRGARVEGRVVGADGVAAPGARVVLFTMDGDLTIWGPTLAGPPHPAGAHLLGEATTDGVGRFAFEHAPSKGFHDVRQMVTSMVTGRKVGAWLLATKPGFTTAIGEVAIVEEGGRVSVEMRLHPAFSVEGRVVDGDGKPVARAQVWANVLREGLMIGIPEDLRATFPTEGAYTAADGTYRMNGVQIPASTDPPFGIGAAATHSVLGNAERDSAFVAVSGPYEGVLHAPDVVLRAHPLPFGNVHVLGEDGRPLAGAELGWSLGSMNLRTDAEGRARVEWYVVVPEGVGLPAQSLFVRAPGHALASVRLTLARNSGEVAEPVEVRLHRGRMLAGRVTAEGGPLPEGTKISVGNGSLAPAQALPWAFPNVEPRALPPGTMGEYGSASVGRDGGFELSELPDGPYHVIVSWEPPQGLDPTVRSEPVVSIRSDVPTGAKDVGIVFHVPPAVATRDVDLRVVDADTGEPALRPWGELVGFDPPGTQSRRVVGRRFAPGVLRLSRVASGRYVFYGGAEGYVMTTVDPIVVEAGDDLPFPVVKVRRGARIVGKITVPGGSPVRGQVIVEPYDSNGGKVLVSADANGAFVAEGLPAGRYRVTAASRVVPGFASYSSDPVALVDLPVGTAEVRVEGAWVVAGTADVAAKGARFVGASEQGFLTAAQVEALEGVVFDVAEASGRVVHHRARFTTSDPRVAFTGVLPPGAYTARLSVPGEPVRERRFEVEAGKRVGVLLE